MSRRAALFGAGGGIGSALATQLCADPQWNEVWLDGWHSDRAAKAASTC